MEDCSGGVCVRWRTVVMVSARWRTVVVVSVSDGGLYWWCLCQMEDCSCGVCVRWRTVVVVSVLDGGL